jgi:hypothetical protein
VPGVVVEPKPKPPALKVVQPKPKPKPPALKVVQPKPKPKPPSPKVVQPKPKKPADTDGDVSDKADQSQTKPDAEEDG